MSSSNYQRFQPNDFLLYNIGIKCLVATIPSPKRLRKRLYNIGIKCLVATALTSIPDE